MSARKPFLLIDSAGLRSRLKLKHLQSELMLKTHHPEAIGLLEAAGVKPGNIRRHAKRLLTSGVLTASLFLTPGQAAPTQAALPESANHSPISHLDLNQSLKQQLMSVLPSENIPLTADQELSISGIIHRVYGLHASAELEGNRLNTSYGLMGYEQHLPRYPGDTVENHGSFLASGITPGRGAWGYFAPSRADLTPDLVQTEKYYVAVQTLYLPDWSIRLAYLRDWYKYRRVVVLNPRNGRVIIAAVADSGPAAWTGKNFGGSPEVIDYLNLRDRQDIGPVILFFVDDPDKKIELGPLEYNLEAGPPLLAAPLK